MIKRVKKRFGKGEGEGEKKRKKHERRKIGDSERRKEGERNGIRGSM